METTNIDNLFQKCIQINDISTRYPLQEITQGFIFPYIQGLSNLFALFEKEIFQNISNIEQKQLMYEYINNKFTPYIKQYYDFYNENLNKIEKLTFTNWYKNIFELYQSIEKTIIQIQPITQQPEIKRTNRKTPKLNDYNKPVLTQTQTAILFKVFKLKNIFSNRDITDSKFTEIIGELTGFAEEKLRQKFTQKYNEISVKTQDYEQIITTLNEVLKEIEKIKTEIPDTKKRQNKQ